MNRCKATLLASILATSLAAAGGSNVARACDDHYGECEIEAWTWNTTGQYLIIDGVSTCDKGRIYLRMYDGNGGFIGVERTRIKAHTFRAIYSSLKASPSDVSIKYSIEPR